MPGVPGELTTQTITIALNTQAKTRIGVEAAETSNGSEPQMTPLIAMLVSSQGSQRRTASAGDPARSIARQMAAWHSVFVQANATQMVQVGSGTCSRPITTTGTVTPASAINDPRQ